MRTGAACGHVGYVHEAALYASDEELLALAVPFVLAGRAAGEPTYVALGARTERLVREALDGDAHGVAFLSQQYATPAATIRTYQRMLTEHVASGAAQVRVLGEVPHSGAGGCWQAWARYEAAINELLGPFPLWGICPYDLRVTPDDVVEDVLATHPRVIRPDGEHVTNPAFVPPPTFLAGRRAPVPDAFEAGSPDGVLAGPSPAGARELVGHLATWAGLDDEARSGLLVAVTEVVTNAVRHGRAPVVLRAWQQRGRVVVAVRDEGKGPDDPYAGLAPSRGGLAEGGRGLWIAHQLCAHVGLGWDDGFTVRLVAGRALL